MKLATGALVLLALLLPADAVAVTINSPNPVYQRWTDESHVPTPTSPLQVVEAPCELTAACTDGETIWIAPSLGRGIFLHELGHAFAIQYNLPIGQDDDPAGERFADSYSLCATGWPRSWEDGKRIESPMGLILRTKQVRRTCRAIRG